MFVVRSGCKGKENNNNPIKWLGGFSGMKGEHMLVIIRHRHYRLLLSAGRIGLAHREDRKDIVGSPNTSHKVERKRGSGKCSCLVKTFKK